MTRRLITASSLLSLAACVAGPGYQTAPIGTDGAAVAPLAPVAASPVAISPEPIPPLRVTSLAWGEEEDGSGTVVTTLAIGEEDGHFPAITTLTHGEEEDGSGTQIDDQPIILPEPQSFLATPPASHQLASVADIMARLRPSEG